MGRDKLEICSGADGARVSLDGVVDRVWESGVAAGRKKCVIGVCVGGCGWLEGICRPGDMERRRCFWGLLLIKLQLPASSANWRVLLREEACRTDSVVTLRTRAAF